MKILLIRQTLCLLLFSLLSFSSWGFGNGSDPDPGGSGAVNTDENRAKVKIYKPTSTFINPTYDIELEITLDASHIYGTFNPNDLIIIVDMVQGGRNYDLATVTYYNPVTRVIEADCHRTDAALPNVDEITSSSPRDYVQVFKVPEYISVTLGIGDVLTCHAWDGYTGGILAFLCQGTLTFNGGGIDTQNKGQEGYLGQPGGAGASAISNSLNGIGGTGPILDGTDALGGTTWPSFAHKGGVAPFISSNSIATCDIKIGGNGGCGGNSLDGQTVTPHSHIFSTASFSTKTMNFGRGGAEGRSGQGPGAGGHGGGGGMGHTSGTNGSLGVAPTPGAKGGDGGNGGRGGGMVYIKAGYINAPLGGMVINTGGSAGTMGTDASGGPGGNGGAGGKGGDGGCTNSNPNFTFFGPGGAGGHGTPGNGGDGGDGGNGGDAGEVWILHGGTSNFSTSNILSQGGAGGPGNTIGTKHGEWEYIMGGSTMSTYFFDQTSVPPQMTPPLENGIAVDGCNPTMNCNCIDINNPMEYGERVTLTDNSCDIIKCQDCDEAMWLLGLMTKYEKLSTGYYKYTNPVPGPAGKSSYCLKTPEGLFAWYVDANTLGTCSGPGEDAEFRAPTYFCNFVDPNANTGAWEHIATQGMATTMTTSPIEIEWDITGHGKINYSSAGGDILTWPIGNAETACTNGSSGGGSSQQPNARPRDGFAGNPGTPGANTTPELTTTPPTGGNAWKRDVGIDEVNAFGLELMPVPARDFVNFKVTAPSTGAMQVRIYDMNGKMLQTNQFAGSREEVSHQLDVSSLAPGSYVFSISQGAYKQDQRLIIER